MNSFLNRYHIVYPIQADTNSRVLVVEDQKTSKKYIAKSVYKTSDVQILHQFHVEVDVLSQLNVGNTPVLVDVFETPTELILVETYIDGDSLDMYLKNHKVFNSLKRKWLFTIFDIFEQIHSLDFLYIDLKPNNLIVYHDEIHLIDFNSCIEMNSTRVVSASKINKAPEYDLNIPLHASSDVYALGQLFLYLFPYSLISPIAKKCVKDIPEKRYQSISSLRKAFKLTELIKKIGIFLSVVIVIVCLLLKFIFFNNNTVFDSYLKDKEPDLFINAYVYTLNQQSGSYTTQIQSNLYEWIDKDWISKSVYSDSKCANFLLKQAIQSNNSNLCSYILDQIPEKTQSNLDEIVLITNAYILQNQMIDYEVIHNFIQSLNKKSLTRNQKMEYLNIILNVCFESEIIVSEEDYAELIQILETISYNDGEEYKNLIRVYLNYCLFIKNENRDVYVDDDFINLFKDDSSMMTLIEYLKS